MSAEGLVAVHCGKLERCVLSWYVVSVFVFKKIFWHFLSYNVLCLIVFCTSSVNVQEQLGGVLNVYLAEKQVECG